MLDESRVKRTKFELDYFDLLIFLKEGVQELKRESRFSHLRDEFLRFEANLDDDSFVYGLWAILVSWNLDGKELRGELMALIESKAPGRLSYVQEDLSDIYR